MFVLREARRLRTLLTCTTLASFYPINPPAWCYVVVAKIIPGLVGAACHSENVSPNGNLSPSRRAQRPEISWKPGEDKDGSVRFQAAGEQPGFAEGPRRRLPFQSGGNFRGGNCLKMKIAKPWPPAGITEGGNFAQTCLAKTKCRQPAVAVTNSGCAPRNAAPLNKFNPRYNTLSNGMQTRGGFLWKVRL